MENLGINCYKKITTGNPSCTVASSAMITYIELFFRWQSSLSLYLDKDELLSFVPGEYQMQQTPNTALLLSVCALGALMSAEITKLQVAEDFAMSAERLLLDFNSVASTPNNVQALMCCAWFSLGQGDGRKAWMLSGLWSQPELRDLG